MNMDKGKDLSKEAPRSPRVRLGGYVMLARTLDKCRADLNGTTASYHFDCPMDNVLFGFKGVSAADFKDAVSRGLSDEAMVEWINAHGIPRSPEEITKWSDTVERSSLYSMESKRDYFASEVKKLGLIPEKTTTFDWLEADDRASFT
jgi:hypothetical protein